MKYTVTTDGKLSYTVEREDGEEYYVNFQLFKEKWVCTCIWNVLTGKPCKHIRMCKEFTINDKSVFEE